MAGTLVIHVNSPRAEWWRERLQALLPELQCRLWDDAGDPEDVVYAAVWRPPPGGLKRFPRLQAVFSIGAGVDHVFNDPALPAVPVIRLTGAALNQRMREYVALHVLHCHRRQNELEAAQQAGRWQQVITPPAGDCGVGVMGLGQLGGAAARTLHGLGFRVAGWSRSAHDLPGVDCFHGPDQRDAFLARTQMLVCLLPLTPATDGILDRELFDHLPRGAWVINAGRGEHLVEADLLAALADGQLGGAVLDVFRTEPLPPDHPFWRHPRITVTPHVASLIDPETGGRLLAAGIRRFMAGDHTTGVIDAARRY